MLSQNNRNLVEQEYTKKKGGRGPIHKAHQGYHRTRHLSNRTQQRMCQGENKTKNLKAKEKKKQKRIPRVKKGKEEEKCRVVATD